MKVYMLKVVNISHAFSSSRIKMTKSTNRRLENAKTKTTLTDVSQKREK